MNKRKDEHSLELILPQQDLFDLPQGRIDGQHDFIDHDKTHSHRGLLFFYCFIKSLSDYTKLDFKNKTKGPKTKKLVGK